MTTLNRTFQLVRRSLALSALLGAGLAVAHAQQATTPAVTAAPSLNFQVPMDARNNTFSSSADDQVADAEIPFDFIKTNDAQPPRRRYGRPRYRGGNTNPDGSNKWAFLVGGGFTTPVGNTHEYLSPSWGFQVGAGRNFDKHFGLIAQFDWDNFGFQGHTLDSQFGLYNTAIEYYNETQTPDNQVSLLDSLDGSTHIWSFSLNPTYTFSSDEGIGGYVVGGIGFYHKRADFTVPGVGEYCDPFYGYCYEVQANQTYDDYTSNAPGLNGGFGVTYKFSHFSSARLYGEVRYVYIFNEQRPGVTLDTVSPGNFATANFFPANSNRTSYIPVKFGIRF